MRILIAGGGIAGLTSAIALARGDNEIVVLEQSDYSIAASAGVQISPNASRVLEQMNLGRELRAIAAEPRAIEVRAHRSGLKVAEFALGAAARARYGAPYYQVHRAELIHLLHSAAIAGDRVKVVPGTTITGIDSSADQAQVQTQSGKLWTGDLLIGADGIHSRALAYVDPSTEPQFTGMVAWRALVPVDAIPDAPLADVVTLWPGPGAHVVQYCVSHRQFINLIGCIERDDWTDPSWKARGTRAELQRDFAGWHSSLRRLFDYVDEPYLWALYDHAQPDSWTRKRVTLVGDACHPMLPFAAQGAAQAIEDAWALADCLRRTQYTDEALAAFEQKRRERIERVQQESSRRAALYHQKSLPQKLATLLPILTGGTGSSGWASDELDWLYGYDVTASTNA